MTRLECFKAYDIRGRLPEQLNEEVAWRIGRTYAELLRPKQVAVGCDVRPSSAELSAALVGGLLQGGSDVLDLGLCGTEEIYHAVFSQQLSGGIVVTASHNPIDYNGMKLVREQSRPISGDSGLLRLKELAEQADFSADVAPGRKRVADFRSAYIEHLMSYLDPGRIAPLNIVVNPGNGCAGPVIDRLEKQLPCRFTKVCYQPDGSFPNGIPNPLLPENRSMTHDAVIANGADLGIAWDGDFDRCFFFDEQGRFIEGYYIVGLLAQALLEQDPGEKIIHDPRLTWNTIDMVSTAGGTPIQSKTGHAFIKERMRVENALYGGEMSAHHYFRRFAYCDSGMIPWLMVIDLLSRSGKPLSQLVDERIARFPASGEINRQVEDSGAVLERVYRDYRPQAVAVDDTDGYSFVMDQWRFNLRRSNTEPVIRLNVESRGDRTLMEEKTAELLRFIDQV